VIDFSPANNLLVTGSRDCTIRGWNPYATDQPVMVLRGHEAPVMFLRVNEIKVRNSLSLSLSLSSRLMAAAVFAAFSLDRRQHWRLWKFGVA